MDITLGDTANQISVKEEGDEIVVRFKKDKQIGPSSSGKSTLIATTRGNQKLPNGMTLAVNCYRKK